jgi:serine protease AprX
MMRSQIGSSWFGAREKNQGGDMAHGSSRFFSNVALCATVLLAQSGRAGDVLKFKNGNVDISTQAAKSFAALHASSADSKPAGYFVVQFKSPFSETERDLLTKRGLKIYGYVPEDAVIVKAENTRNVNALYELPGVRGVTEYAPEFKVSAELADLSRSKSELILHLLAFDASEGARIAQDLKQAGALDVMPTSGRSVFARISSKDLSQIGSVEGVEWIEQYVPMMMHDFESQSLEIMAPGDYSDLSGYESGTKVMNFDKAWAKGLSGKGQVVGISDTGLDTGSVATLHQDFGNLLKGLGFANGGVWKDTQGHGTHVAGSVGGTGKVSGGKIKGGAYGASLVFQGLWDNFAGVLSVPPSLDKVFGGAYQLGARVHTNSWGSSRNAYDNFAIQVDDYMWRNPEMLVVFAAGNSGKDANRDGRIDNGSLGSPATSKNCLSVGASENLVSGKGNQARLTNLSNGAARFPVAPLSTDTLSNNPNGLAAFSSRGPTADGRLKPDIVAPGTNILSARSSDPAASPMWGAYNAKYTFAGGTSMATPLTAGAAAVVREHIIKQGIPRPSAALVKAVLMHTAQDLFPGQYGTGKTQEIPTKRPNVHEGYGRVEMGRATSVESLNLKDETIGVGLNETKTFAFKVAAGQKFTVTLSYTDAPGTASAAKALVNDLDLIVADAAGRTLGTGDRTNNHEMFEINGATSGTYKISVKGIKVPKGKNGKQPFALVMTAQ